jgi:hypothetical protein
MSSKRRLNDLLAEVADEAEAAEADQTERPIPDHVKVTRGNPRSKVLQVRLNPDEMAALEAIAERRELPVSTIAREQLLRLIAADTAAGHQRDYVYFANIGVALAGDDPQAGGGEPGEMTNALYELGALLNAVRHVDELAEHVRDRFSLVSPPDAQRNTGSFVVYPASQGDAVRVTGDSPDPKVRTRLRRGRR